MAGDAKSPAMVALMDGANLVIVGLMFIVVVVSQFIQANMLIGRFERLQRVVLLWVQVSTLDEDAAPWEAEAEAETKPAIDERDFG